MRTSTGHDKPRSIRFTSRYTAQWPSRAPQVAFGERERRLVKGSPHTESHREKELTEGDENVQL